MFQLAVQVRRGRGFPKVGAKESVRVQCTFNSEIKETAASSFYRGHGGGQDPAWSGDDGCLSWQVSRAQLQSIKRASPRVKLHVFSVPKGAPSRSRNKSLGYVMLDISAAEVALSENVRDLEKWYKMNSGHGELEASMRVIALREVAPGSGQ